MKFKSVENSLKFVKPFVRKSDLIKTCKIIRDIFLVVESSEVIIV